MITMSIMLANIMQGVDNTILNVALPHVQGSLSASLDQIAWALTSYIVCAAIMMPLTGWLAGRFGIKYIFLASVIGFTVASALCGAATSLGELVLFRALQGVAGAGLVPLSQATLLQINPPERHGHAMAVFGTGTILGPIMGPALGGWLTYDYGWRWVFYINLPVGAMCTLAILVFVRQTRYVHREPFDIVGFLTLSLGIGALQLMLDRGELKDWFHSSEIWIEAAVAGVGFYLFTVHTVTTDERSFLNRDLLKSANFVAGTLLVFCGGLIQSGTLALLPTMLQNLMNYPALTTGLVIMPRGIGSMVAMFIVARLIDRIDSRLLILFGLLLAAAAMWQMSCFSLQMDTAPIIIAGLCLGFGLGCTQVPLNIIALSTLPRHIMTQGTAIRSLMRNLGGSVGISILVATLAENTQIVHSRLVEGLRPDNPLVQAPYLAAPFNLSTPSGLAALNAEVTRQAAMVAYVDDFKLLMVLALATIPLLLLLREARHRPPPAAAIAPDAADD
ncbi:MAG TPA: DHA2 family efflux MFS transporter permease subunit [Stellaceae bacterium]|jgi:DHA2 family multidrug resistance protein|nr:DHA2 family efflux MFS transporter permease subunit [Stellaceae bacterium]